MSLMQNKYVFLFLLILSFTEVQAQLRSLDSEILNIKEIKNISGENWTFYSKKTCGFLDRNIFIGNGTFQEVYFFSNEPFSLIVEQDSSTTSFTGISLSRKINMSDQQKIRKNSGYYEISRKNFNKQTAQAKDSKKINENQRYFSSLSIYGVCKTVSFSTHFKEIQVQITFYPNREDKITHNNHSDQQSKQIENLNRVKVNIGATVYCIDGRSIKQANFFVTKLYEVLILSIIGLAFSFKFLRKIPWWLRVICLLGTFYGVYNIDSWYIGLLSTYAMIFIIAIFYRIFQSRSFLSYSRQYLFSKSFIIISIASAMPLAIKSHLDNDKIEHKKILLHLVNIIILCNILLFTQSLIHIRRFRHAFYYFIVFMLAQVFLKQYIQNSLVFNLLQVQIFPSPPQCQQLFFTIIFIPLCDFFFKSYSSDQLFKFLIILLPVVSHPYQIKTSTTFAIGFVLWLFKQAIKGRDLTKIIRYKR